MIFKRKAIVKVIKSENYTTLLAEKALFIASIHIFIKNYKIMDITIFVGCSQTSSFCYVEDSVDGLKTMMNKW